jgi:hypothetical protein
MNSLPLAAARREVADLSAPPPPTGGAGAVLIDPA